ncbi:lipoprotein [Sphingomonas sp. J344]
MNMRTLVVFTALLLAACGNRGDLKPAAGETLPPNPMGRWPRRHRQT